MGGKDDTRINRFVKSLTREQKLTLGVLLVCGVIAFGLAIVQIRRTLNRPFTASLEEFIAFQRMLGPSDEEVTLKQQQTDMDGDGMSDWQELNAYHTSPYLSDSDSDGVPDNIEIARGTDPNCREGEICGSLFGASAAGTSTVSAEDLGATAPVSPDAGNAAAGVPPRDPAAIRAFLKLRGMSEAEIAQYSDEMILESYDAAARGGGPPSGTASEASPSGQAADQQMNITNGTTPSP